MRIICIMLLMFDSSKRCMYTRSVSSRSADPILGENPFDVLNQRLFDQWELDGHGPIPWRLVVWPPLFLGLNMTVGQPFSAAVHTAGLVAFKRLVLGPLPPGRQDN